MKKQSAKVSGTIYVDVDIAHERDFEKKMALDYRVSEFHDVRGFTRYAVRFETSSAVELLDITEALNSEYECARY